MKAGIKTSEFWITLSAIGGIVWTFAQQNCDFTPEKLLSLASLVLAALYTGARTYLKAKTL